MLELKISTEAFVDLNTLGIRECIEGLPVGVILTDVSFDKSTDTLTYIFDDGKNDIKPVRLKFIGVIPE